MCPPVDPQMFDFWRADTRVRPYENIYMFTGG